MSEEFRKQAWGGGGGDMVLRIVLGGKIIKGLKISLSYGI
jgi:hypothetical protein